MGKKKKIQKAKKSKRKKNKPMNYKKKFNKEEIIKYPIDKEELDQLENSITNNYFEFEIDTIDLYDKNIIPYILKKDKEIINIDDNFYKNIKYI